jgi:hypothetical protein
MRGPFVRAHERRRKETLKRVIWLKTRTPCGRWVFMAVMMTRIEKMTTKFDQVKAGLEANGAMRAEVAKQEKARWKEVFAKIPAARQKMATILLSDPRVHMTDAEIIATCHVGLPSSEGDTSTKQALYAAGLTEAARLLDKPVPTIPEAYPAQSREFQLDPALYAAGEKMARELKPFIATAR